MCSAGEPGPAQGPQRLHVGLLGKPGPARGSQRPHAGFHWPPGSPERCRHPPGGHEQLAGAPECAAGVPGHGQQGPGGELEQFLLRSTRTLLEAVSSLSWRARACSWYAWARARRIWR
eukprot:1159626-Pelagomonas_calceolata.AAC.1